MNFTDKQLVELYSRWSEETYCAGFLSPSEESVKSFRIWLKGPDARYVIERDLEDYEQKMVEIYRIQELKESVERVRQNDI